MQTAHPPHTMCTLFPFCLPHEKEITADDLEDVIQSLAIHIAAREHKMGIHAAEFKKYRASGDRERQRAEEIQYGAHKEIRSRYLATYTKLVQISIQLATTSETIDIAHAMGNAKDVLGTLIAKVRVVDIDALMDELNEYKIEATDLSEAMGRVDEVGDDDVLMAELVPSPTPAHAPAHALAPPRSGGATMELPTVPISAHAPTLAPPLRGGAVEAKTPINTKQPTLA